MQSLPLSILVLFPFVFAFHHNILGPIHSLTAKETSTKIGNNILAFHETNLNPIPQQL